MTVPTPDQILGDLRTDIDRIDAAMHALLIERGDIIERLIAVKASQGGGSAFRPGREAEMMRRLAERHRGPLPRDAVESIWRIIISTFTFVQAPYAVHATLGANAILGANATLGADEGAMRDTARFHFGFTVPLVAHADAPSVIAAVAEASGDLGLLPVGLAAGEAPWWPLLASEDAPKVIARLPFVERGDHPAGRPVFVIARPGAAAAAVHAMTLILLQGRGADAMPDLGGFATTIGTSPAMQLVATADSAALMATLATRHPDRQAVPIGSHAVPYVVADASAPAR